MCVCVKCVCMCMCGYECVLGGGDTMPGHKSGSTITATGDINCVQDVASLGLQVRTNGSFSVACSVLR